MKLLRALCGLAVVLAWATASMSLAQKSAPAPAGPVPPAIIHAKSIFVSNAGSDRDLFPGIFSEDQELPYLFTGDEERPYAEFYTVLNSTGDYNLLSDPSQADLVLELQLRAHYGPVYGAPGPLAEFRLVVYGSQSHYVLWTITQALEPAILQKNRDKNFDQAVTNVLNEFLNVAGKGPLPSH